MFSARIPRSAEREWKIPEIDQRKPFTDGDASDAADEDKDENEDEEGDNDDDDDDTTMER